MAAQPAERPDDQGHGALGSSKNPRYRYQARAAAMLDRVCDASGLDARELAARLGDTVSRLDIERWRQGEGEFPAWVIAAVENLSDVDGAKARAAHRLDEACEASGLPTISLVAAVRSSTGVPISAIDIERWRQGDADFPAWVISAIADVAGMEGEEAGWVIASAPAAIVKTRRLITGRRLMAVGTIVGLLVLGGAYAGYRLTRVPATPPTTAARGGGEEVMPNPATSKAPAASATGTPSSQPSQPAPSAPPVSAGQPQPTGNGPTGSGPAAGSSAPPAQPPTMAAARQSSTQPPAQQPAAPPPATAAPAKSAPPASPGLVGGLLTTVGGTLGAVLGLLGL
jgi:hypothetical protein